MDLDSCTLKSRALMTLSGLYLHPVTLLLAVYQFVFFLLQMSFSHVVVRRLLVGPILHVSSLIELEDIDILSLMFVFRKD